ncbi:Apr 01_1 [Blepharisma stoltei]|uniref:Peptidase A1 domain-containing protein n=1 Tax=Blepharisma stoltei TaxID=1481888 RepID=A0AAU9J1F7_9CILI|nr:unnamed protein product [Blepharisma stoltei]
MKLLDLWISIALASVTIDLYWGSLRYNNKLDEWKSNSQLSNLKKSFDQSNSNFQSEFYYTELSLGTPLQEFTFLININTEWTWVEDFESKNYLGKHQFNSKLSSSFSNSTDRKVLKSLEGEISGYKCTENLAINNFLIQNQSFILVDYHSGIKGISKDGVFGLGVDSSSEEGSYIHALQKQGKISRKQFSLYIASSEWNLPSSNLIIDGDNLFKYSSESAFTYISLTNSSRFWEVPCDSVTFGGAVYLEANRTIFETVSSMIAGPETAISDILKTLSTEYGCETDSFENYKCGCEDKYPDMTFYFEGHGFTIKYTDYLKEIDGVCYPIFKHSSDAQYWSLGTNFMKRFYISFDLDKKQVGLAKARLLKASAKVNAPPISKSSASDQQEANITAANTNQVSAAANSTTNSGSSNSSDLSAGEIALIVVLPSGVLIILFFIIKFLLWRRSLRDQEEEAKIEKPAINKSEEPASIKEEKEVFASESNEFETSHLSFDIGKEFSKESEIYEKENIHRFAIIKTDHDQEESSDNE